jgi:hypothetical protein
MWELAWDNLLRGVRFGNLRNPVTTRRPEGPERGEGAS